MIIVGLGNPGEEYADTFHNMGFMVADAIAELLNKKITKIECSALTAVKDNKDGKLILAKPVTYMNASGGAVKGLLTKYKQTPADLIVIYDDIDLDRFSVRVREKGSAGTHNGMRNIVEKLGTDNFKRVRMGIGRDVGDLKDFVLKKINAEDLSVFRDRAKKIAEIILEYADTKDFDRFMRKGNSIK